MDITKNRKTNIYLIVYYFILLLMLVSRKDATSEPSIVLRLGFLIAVVAPCLISKSVSYPAVIIMFSTIARFGFAYSYMPYMTYIYVFITLLVFIIYERYRGINIIKAPPFLIFFTIYIFFIDTITGFRNPYAKFPEEIFYCFLMLLCFFNISSKTYSETLKQLPIIVSIITIVLSLFFLLNRNEFAQDYGYDTGLERSGWTDPNYFGMVIGMGAIISIITLFEKKWKHLPLLEKILYISGIIISVPALVLNASRGALLSLIISFIVVILFSKSKMLYKVLIILLSLVGIAYLYNNNYFELLEYRISSDDGTGSNRTVIWTNKLEHFINGSIINIVFGYGYAGGGYITGEGLGFHNEFVAFLVDYGIVGLSLLCYMLYYPLKFIKRKDGNFYVVITLLVYLGLCLMTLEPLTLAIPSFFLLYLYIVIISKSNVLYLCHR